MLTTFFQFSRCSQPQHRDLATPTLLHFGSAQARPFAIIDRLFKVLPALFGVALNFRSSHHGRGALQLADEDLPPGGRSAKGCEHLRVKMSESEQLFVATERNAKLRYEGYKKLSEM